MYTYPQSLSPVVQDAVNSFICSQELAHYGPNDKLDAAWRFAYAEECKLFNEFFPKFSEADRQVYQDFTQWLDESRMWESDLTVNELYEVYYGLFLNKIC